MPNQRPKIKYAPRTWTGVFPAMVILFVMLLVGSALYIVPTLYGYVASNNMFTYLTNVAQAQRVYYAAHKSYADNANLLRLDNGQPVKAPLGVDGKILAACDNGWVAYAQSNFGGTSKLYSSSASTYPGALNGLTLPSCVTAAELSGTTLGEDVQVKNVKVTRASATGTSQEGAASPKKSREGATITWEETTSCGKDENPIYRVRVVRKDLADRKIPDSLKKPVDYTTGKTRLSVSGILNGISYQLQVSGKCGENYPYGKATSVNFTQQLPTPAGIVGRWGNGKLNTMYGKVSSSAYIHYQVQVLKGGTGTWRTIIYDIDPTATNSFGFKSYAASYGDRYRVRAYTVDGSAYSGWSQSRAVVYRSYS